MTREEALAQLGSGSSHDRLKAARFLARHSDPSDLHVLRNAHKNESVSYVRTGLAIAINRASNLVPRSAENYIDELEIPSDVRSQIRNEAIEEVTGQILHEIASPVGLIASAATREIPDYENSKTRIQVENLKRIFEAVEQLKVATAAPRPEEFDLSEFLFEVASEVVEGRTVEVSFQGSKPMLISSDRALLRLGVVNGMRNAVEAVVDLPGSVPHPIVVTWGETDIDYWVAVVDRGPGLVGPAESAFGIGKTTKKGHSGFGLTIARQAAETLGGVCTLQLAAEGGARFEIRWER